MNSSLHSHQIISRWIWFFWAHAAYRKYKCPHACIISAHFSCLSQSMMSRRSTQQDEVKVDQPFRLSSVRGDNTATVSIVILHRRANYCCSLLITSVDKSMPYSKAHFLWCFYSTVPGSSLYRHFLDSDASFWSYFLIGKKASIHRRSHVKESCFQRDQREENAPNSTCLMISTHWSTRRTEISA